MKPFLAATPCGSCGSNWQRWAVDTSDEDAEELPLLPICAKCRTRPELDTTEKASVQNSVSVPSDGPGT